jgi:NAD-dependent dihydropyrimidine dehydrogenase PreA subunit
MPFVVTEACVDVNDRRCLTECPVDCIYAGARMLYIHPDECIDCGACEPLCPVQAIHHEDDLPEQLSAYRAINREFFSSGEPSGGAELAGVARHDHPAVAALAGRQTAGTPETGGN